MWTTCCRSTSARTLCQPCLEGGERGGRGKSHTASFSTSAARHEPFHQRPLGCPTCTNHASGSRLVSNTYASLCSSPMPVLVPADATGTSWTRACKGASAARGEVSFLREEDMTQCCSVEEDKKWIYKKKKINHTKKKAKECGEWFVSVSDTNITHHANPLFACLVRQRSSEAMRNAEDGPGSSSTTATAIGHAMSMHCQRSETQPGCIFFYFPDKAPVELSSRASHHGGRTRVGNLPASGSLS